MLAWTSGAALPAQDPEPPPPRTDPFGWIAPATVEGKPVRGVDVLPPGAVAERVRLMLQIRAGEALQRRLVSEDLRRIWKELKLPCRVDFRDADGGVALVYTVKDSPVYTRHQFKGLSHFTQTQVNSLLELAGTQHWTDWSAKQKATYLQEFYRRDGYLHARVDIKTEPLLRTVTFLVDEGPRVTVRNIRFIGNRAFPADAWFNLTDNLLGGAKLDVTPRLFDSAEFSELRVQQDVERLRLFYRGKGYRDADVELVGVDFTPDGAQVDLTFLIDEGERYRVASVDVRMVPASGRSEPLYGRDELLALLEVKVGDYYDRERINLDTRALERFYGKRGHPSRRRYGANLANTFAVEGPKERFDYERKELHLTYVVEEGAPKTLHSIRIVGNTDTQDAVIRREIHMLPGERLDMDEMERARSRLESLRYFQDPETLLGPQLFLEPVSPDRPDDVVLVTELGEGKTGALTWGVGVSSDFGVQGTVQFEKRNFDLFRTPSTYDPIEWIKQIADNRAFHGGGQELNVLFQPGTQRTDFRVSFYEPDVFSRHFDTIGLRVDGYRTRQFWESFTEASFGAAIGLDRRFTENLRGSISIAHETSRVRDVDPNAPTLVFDAEGQTELRSLRGELRYFDLDRLLRPTSGIDARVYYHLYGGLLGGGTDFFKTGVSADLYLPIYEDDRERFHVLRLEQSFEVADTFDATRDVYPTERFYMGGRNLRGFSRRRAGPTQFTQPTGGEAMYLATLEYGFPLVSTRLAGQLYETEILRGVILTDFGLLGSSLTNPDFGEPRLASGVGIRFTIPGLNLPLALDLAWPILFEESDDRRQFFFSLSPR